MFSNTLHLQENPNNISGISLNHYSPMFPFISKRLQQNIGENGKMEFEFRQEFQFYVLLLILVFISCFVIEFKNYSNLD